jgi:dolichyl-phosphate beta-glucosyltransferase
MLSAAAPRVSVIVPVYNEALRLPASLRTMEAYFSGVAFTYEVLIVVEHSTDGTLELAAQATATQANFQVMDNQVHRGKGFAVRSGILGARGEFVFYMDADLSTPLDEITKFLSYFESHPEVHVLLGNRQHTDSHIDRRQSVLRQNMGQLFNRVIRSLAPVDVRDTQCGFKAFRQPAAREIFSRQTIDGFAFDVEVLLLARALGYAVKDLPVRWENSPESKVHIIRDSLRMMRDTLTVRARVERAMRQAARPR